MDALVIIVNLPFTWLGQTFEEQRFQIDLDNSDHLTSSLDQQNSGRVVSKMSSGERGERKSSGWRDRKSYLIVKWRS
jgi:hypothetical protein